jgi:hypothetical protein
MYCKVNIYYKYNILYMKLIKKFEEFIYGGGAGQPAPETRPVETPTKPGTKPSQRPGKPSPIRRDKPAVDPAPKAEKDKEVELPTATIEDIMQKFAKLTNQKN